MTTLIKANFPTELCDLAQWTGYRIVQKPDAKKPTKVPYSPHGDYEASSTDPKTWGTLETACKAVDLFGYDGKGFVFTESDPYAGIDFDDCVINGKIDPDVWDWVQRLDSYAEYSPSGTGIHVFVRATMPDGKGRKHTKRGIEMYDRGRYFTMTGRHVEETPLAINERQPQLDALYAELFPKQGKINSSPISGGTVNVDDAQLMELMFASANGGKIQRLWNGDCSDYPGANGKPDHSSADQALCNYLAFWTNHDEARMDRMFRASSLFREKWNRKDYREGTIKKAIEGSTEGYRGPYQRNGQIVNKTYGIDIDSIPEPPAAHLNGNGSGTGHYPDPTIPFADKPHNTDMGNAIRMYEHAKDRVMYVSQFSKWYTWEATNWLEDDSFNVLGIAKQTILKMYGELPAITDDDKRKDQLKWIVASESRSRLEAMIALLRSEPNISVRADILDQHPMLLPVKNGTIDLTTGDLLPSDPAHRFTKCLDVEYDPSAECPLWEKFLIRIMDGNLELVSFIQRLVGHALTGDATGKYFVFMWGEKGNNGKSTLAETIMRLLGPFAMKSPTEMVMAKSYRGGVPNDIARLRGVRFTVANEVDEGMTLSEGVIKDLTGQDTLSARFMRGEYFDFAPTHKLWMYGNHRPEIRGTNPAIWDRVKLIPFEVEIPENERDPQLQEKLAAELPGILAWAVRGCLQWQKLGIAAPEIVKVATGEYRAEQDVLAQFIDECCELGRSYDVPARTLYQSYEAWCKEMGIKSETGTKFGRELTKRGFDVERDGKGKSRLGIQLNTYGRSILPTPTPHWADEK